MGSAEGAFWDCKREKEAGKERRLGKATEECTEVAGRPERSENVTEVTPATLVCDTCEHSSALADSPSTWLEEGEEEEEVLQRSMPQVGGVIVSRDISPCNTESGIGGTLKITQ